MKKTIRDSIIEVHLTEEMINTFFGQIGILSILGGLYLNSWIAFGLLLLVPLIIFLLSKKYRWCCWASIILCIIYACVWCAAGVIIGRIFSISASIVLGIIFSIPGVAYNWCAYNYFRE